LRLPEQKDLGLCEAAFSSSLVFEAICV